MPKRKLKLEKGIRGGGEPLLQIDTKPLKGEVTCPRPIMQILDPEYYVEVEYGLKHKDYAPLFSQKNAFFSNCSRVSHCSRAGTEEECWRKGS